jgi:ankyrin repeat protein
LLDQRAETKSPIPHAELQEAFQAAVWETHREAATELLYRGANLTIHTAAGLGRKEKIAELLQHNPKLLRSKAGRLGCGPLYWAVAAGEKEIVAYLLAKGANAKEKHIFNCTPMHHAALHGHVEIAELLCAHKVPVDITGSCAETPLFWAVRAGKAEMVRWLLAHKADVNHRSYEGMIQAFRPNGFFSEEGKPLVRSTPLHQAVIAGHEPIVSLLIASKADVNATGIGGTPLDCALAADLKSIAAVLRAHGAKPSKRR